MLLRKLLVCVVVFFLVSTAFGEDKTPYPFAFFGNIFNTPGGVSDFHYNTAYGHWLSDRTDMILNGTKSWQISLRESDTSLPVIWVGPYASCQEINLLSSANPGLSYNDRLKDTVSNWQYIYAKSYLEDSVGMSVESLVVHVADNSVTINQHGDGSRTINNIQSLPYHKRRFTYQYWNNTSSDTAFYPMGYVWLANGYCDQTAAAIASAYYRAFIETPEKQNWPSWEWDCYYMDNHARRLSFMAYWDLTSSSGGQEESYLEWIEGDTLPVRANGGSHVMESQLDYFDNSVLKIDSAIHSRLMSDGHSIRGFANVYMTHPNDLPPLLKHVAGVTFESPIDYGMSWGTWKQVIASFDTLANYPDKYSFLEYRGDFLCQSSGWLSDTSRVIMYGYAFYLIVRTPGTFFGPHELHQGNFGGDRRCWQDAFYVDLGEPDSTWRKLDSTGVSDWTDKTMILYRSYGPNAVIARTGYGSADFSGDYHSVNLHGLYREIDGWTGDTSATADSIFSLRPYEGKVLVAASQEPCDYPPSTPVPSFPACNSIFTDTQPWLYVDNSDHGSCSDPVSYQFEIADDAAFGNVIRQSAWLSEGTDSTGFRTSAALASGDRYYWRCRATNGTATSAWSAACNFYVNQAPSAPEGSAPADESVVNTRKPTLAVTNAADPDGNSLVYYFQVAKDSAFTSDLRQSGAVSQQSGSTSWEVETNLENGSSYYWRSRAYDQIEYGPWMTSLLFTVDAPDSNNAPTTPVLASPPDMQDNLDDTTVILSWYNSTDADGDQITYELNLFDSSGVDLLESVTNISQSGGAVTSHASEYQFENGSWYSWRARAYDSTDYSAWMELARFSPDTSDGDPPTTPVLFSPDDLDTMISLQVSLIAEPSFDPDYDALTYEFAVYSDENQSQLVDSVSGVTSGGSGINIVWPISATLFSGARYYWSCRSYDGQYHSDWAPLRSFWAFDFSVNADQPTPTNLYPDGGVTVSKTKPVLEVTNVVSALDENVYYFEVSRDSTFINRIFSGPVEEDNRGVTSWEVGVPLESNRVYYWRSRANNSPYSELATFRVEADVYLAPNPFRPSAGHEQVQVFNMEPEGVLTITNISNEVIRVLRGNTTGQVSWDVTNGNGRPLASDVYLCYYKDGEKVSRFKFAVIR